MAERLRGAFPDFSLALFPERHHFDPPHRAEPERFARALEALWRRADDAQA
jgi:predicted metallo-beta-lactamase superfamily hydrolase